MGPRQYRYFGCKYVAQNKLWQTPRMAALFSLGKLGTQVRRDTCAPSADAKHRIYRQPSYFSGGAQVWIPPQSALRLDLGWCDYWQVRASGLETPPTKGFWLPLPSRWTIRSARSAGVMPLIRLACERFLG